MIIFASLVHGTTWCRASELTDNWRYLNVAKSSVPMQYGLSIDTRGLPHIVLLGSSVQGSKLTYQFWSGRRWTNSTIRPMDSDTYISSPSILLDEQGSPYIFFIENHFSGGPYTIELATLENGKWRFQAIASHKHISNLSVDRGMNNRAINLIYDFSDDSSRNRHTVLAYASVKKTKIEEKIIFSDSDRTIARFLATDYRNDLYISFTTKTKDGYEELKYLRYGEDGPVLRSLGKGNYHYYSPIILSGSNLPCIFVYNGDRDGIERVCVFLKKSERVLIPDTKDAQLPAVATDSTGRVHISYVDFNKLAYGKQELRYLMQRDDTWEYQTVDYGMNANVELSLDSKNMPHLLYQAAGQVKYATTSTAIRNSGKAVTTAERPAPDLQFEKLPVTPMAAKELISGIPRVRKDSGWAENLELEMYPTAADPVYLFHQYSFVRDDAISGHTVTAGWYHVNAYTGQVTDDMEKVLVKGNRKLKR